MPGAIGKIETAAETLGKIGGAGEPADAGTTSLLWVLRRPLEDD